MKANIFITAILVLQTVVSFSQMNISFSAYVHTPCDTCIDVKANVTGGTAPYTYQWHAKWTPFTASGQNIIYCNKRPTIDSLVLTVKDVNSLQATLENGITQLVSFYQHQSFTDMHCNRRFCNREKPDNMAANNQSIHCFL